MPTQTPTPAVSSQTGVGDVEISDPKTQSLPNMVNEKGGDHGPDLSRDATSASNASSEASDESIDHDKELLILDACRWRNLDQLRALAESPGGFLTDDLRREACKQPVIGHIQHLHPPGAFDPMKLPIFTIPLNIPPLLDESSFSLQQGRSSSVSRKTIPRPTRLLKLL